MSPLCQSVSVHFLSPKPLYVVQGDTLILRTEIDIRTKEVVPTVIWEYVPTHAKHPTRVKVAEYPEQSPSGRVTMEEQGAVLKITNFGPGDSGVYAINVTDHVGQVASAQHVVEEYCKILIIILRLFLFILISKMIIFILDTVANCSVDHIFAPTVTCLQWCLML